MWPGLPSVLCTSHKTQLAGDSSALVLCLPGDSLSTQGDWFLCYISISHFSGKRILVHTPSAGRSLTPWGSVGFLGLLSGPEEGRYRNMQGLARPSRGLLSVMEGEVTATLPYEVFHCPEVHVWVQNLNSKK